MKKVIVLGFVVIVSVYSDSWPPPQPVTYCSSNERYCFEVLPSDSVTGYCAGILWQVNDNGDFTQMWSRHLMNDWAPVDAMVSNDGEYVVTFDEWGMKGYGINVVVIYGQNGEIIERYSLEDIMLRDELDNVPSSVSSRHWKTVQYFDDKGDELVLGVVTIDNDKVKVIRKRIDLGTGEFTTNDDLVADIHKGYEVDEEPIPVFMPAIGMSILDYLAEGTVLSFVIEFVVDMDGSVREAAIARHTGHELVYPDVLGDAMKARFSPAKHKGELVCVRVWIPFKLSR